MTTDPQIVRRKNAAPRRQTLRAIALSWIGVAALLIPLGATLAPESGRLTDLIAGFAAQWSLIALVLAGALLVRKAWTPSAAAAILAALFVALLLPGRATFEPAPAGMHDPAESISVLHLNANTENPSAEEVLGLILQSNADVVSLVEPPTRLVHLIESSGEIARRYAHCYIPEGAQAGWPILLSRWEQRGGPNWEPGPLHTTLPRDGEGYVMRIERPAGPFFMMQTHPASPRSRSRWAEGNTLIDRLVQRVRTELAPLRLPIVLACDLNSSPSGSRSRRLVSDASFWRAKPLWTADGTYPSWLVWPFSTAIDDIFVSDGIIVTQWETRVIPGSDHRAVFTTLRLPKTGQH